MNKQKNLNNQKFFVKYFGFMTGILKVTQAQVDGGNSEIELPSNRKFGLFFVFVFAVLATYFYYAESMGWVYTFIAASLIFLVITLIKSEVLFSLNKQWMRFGLLLGMIISPIIMGIIFYCLITPYSLVMKIFGRDELRLKIKKNGTHWNARSQTIPQTDFKQQF